MADGHEDPNESVNITQRTPCFSSHSFTFSARLYPSSSPICTFEANTVPSGHTTGRHVRAIGCHDGSEMANGIEWWHLCSRLIVEAGWCSHVEYLLRVSVAFYEHVNRWMCLECQDHLAEHVFTSRVDRRTLNFEENRASENKRLHDSEVRLKQQMVRRYQCDDLMQTESLYRRATSKGERHTSELP